MTINAKCTVCATRMSYSYFVLKTMVNVAMVQWSCANGCGFGIIMGLGAEESKEPRLNCQCHSCGEPYFNLLYFPERFVVLVRECTRIAGIFHLLPASSLLWLASCLQTFH